MDGMPRRVLTLRHSANADGYKVSSYVVGCPKRFRYQRLSCTGNAGQDAVTRYALKLARLVTVRPVELRQEEWTEFSLADGEWRKDKEETATPGAAGVSSSRHSSRAPENHWRIKISLPVGEILASPHQ